MLNRGASGRTVIRQLQRTHILRQHSQNIHSVSWSLVAAYPRANGRLRFSSAHSVRKTSREFAPAIRGYASVSRPKAHSGRVAGSKATGIRSARSATGRRGRRDGKSARKPTKKRTVKKPKKVVLSEAQKKAKKIKELKAQALTLPKQLPGSAYLVVSAEVSAGASGLQAAQSSARYRSLSPSEREHYDRIAKENRAKNAEDFSSWIRSHSPATIYQANLARKRLNQLGVAKKQRILHDERRPKRPSLPHIIYATERFDSPDMAGMQAQERIKLAMQEWRGFDASQKQRFVDAYAREKAKFDAEWTRVMG